MITNCVAIFSAVIIIVGWFINSHLNRKNNIAQKRFEYRMGALKSFIDVFYIIEKNSSPFSDPSFLPLLEKARTNFSLYGENDEIKQFERFIYCCKNGNAENATIELNKLVSLVREKIRKELGISQIYY